MDDKTIRFSIRASIAICLIFGILFLMNQDYCSKCPLATDIVGQYGDFVGGVVGTLLSVVLLYSTFRSQIKEFDKNSKVFVKQQFNTTFFHLLDQYNSIIYALEYHDNQDDNPIIYKGKEALHYYLIDTQKAYESDSTNKGRKIAIEYYLNFYSSHKDIMPIYFRTLYRIFDLLESTDIDKKDKAKYTKIIRAQLTDAELVFLRYNTMTVMGRNMAKMIIDYNLLKHIQPLDLLEYDEWRKQLLNSYQNRVNNVLCLVRKNFRHLNKNRSSLAFTSSLKKYHINVSRLNGGTQYKLNFQRDKNKGFLKSGDFVGFDLLSIESIQNLFEAWIKEIFVASYFHVKESRPAVRIQVSSEEVKDKIERFHILITSKVNTEIKLKDYE